jgi:hypothetical protein
MALSSWDNLPLRTKRNIRRLYEHIQDNVVIELDDWADLKPLERRSKIKLWNYLSTKLDLTPWNELTYKQKISRKLRYTVLYNEMSTSKSNLSFTVTDGENPVQGAVVTVEGKTATTGSSGGCTIKKIVDGEHTVTVTADGFEDYTDTITSGETTSFTIELTAVTDETPEEENS